MQSLVRTVTYLSGTFTPDDHTDVCAMEFARKKTLEYAANVDKTRIYVVDLYVAAEKCQQLNGSKGAKCHMRQITVTLIQVYFSLFRVLQLQPFLEKKTPNLLRRYFIIVCDCYAWLNAHPDYSMCGGLRDVFELLSKLRPQLANTVWTQEHITLLQQCVQDMQHVLAASTSS